MEMLIDTYAKFIEEWGKQSRREPYEKACMQVHKRLQVINEEMSNQRGWICIKDIT